MQNLLNLIVVREWVVAVRRCSKLDSVLLGLLLVPLIQLAGARQLGELLRLQVVPISEQLLEAAHRLDGSALVALADPLASEQGIGERSEERRVGKECRSRWSAEQ